MSTVLEVTPSSSFAVAKGEEQPFRLNLNEELGTNTVKTQTMAITNSVGGDVTLDYGGGTSVIGGYLWFGIKGYDTGVFTILFIVTCNEFLPDGITPIEFYVQMRLTVK